MKEVAESDPSADSDFQLFRAMADLISFYMERNCYEDARLLCKELEERGSNTGDSSYVMYSLYMHPKIEQGMELLGESVDDPKTLFLKCCEFCKKEYEKNKSQIALQILAQSYLELGRIAYGIAQMTIAREFYEKSIYYCRYLTDKYSQSRYRNLLSITLAEHAAVECFLKRYNKASEELNEALCLACALYDEYRTPDLCKSVATLYMKLGELYAKTDKIADAGIQYAHAEELLNHYRQQTMGTDAEVALLDLYDNFAELYAKEGHEDIAWNYYCQEDELANSVVRRGKNVDLSFVQWRISIGKGSLLNKAGRVDDAMGMYIAAYESAQEVTSENKSLQRYTQYIRYASVVMIYSHAKENKMSEYAKQYRTKLLTMLPKISIPKSGDLKELWSREAIFGGAAFNPMSTYAEIMGDTFNWAFDDDKFMGIKLQPILKWLKDNLFIWRIPFYPLLSMVLLLLCHMIYGYTNFDRLSACYTGCLIGQTIYQSMSSVIMAVFYAFVRTRKHRKKKKWVNVGASIVISVLVGVAVAGVVGDDALVPDSMHMAYLVLPLYSAGVGCVVTKMADVFLRLVVKE